MGKGDGAVVGDGGGYHERREKGGGKVTGIFWLHLKRHFGPLIRNSPLYAGDTSPVTTHPLTQATKMPPFLSLCPGYFFLPDAGTDDTAGFFWLPAFFAVC